MKDKMRCASCGAMFKPVKSSQTKCDRCEKREREQRAAAKHTGDAGQKPATATPQPVRISGPGASLLGASAPASPGAVHQPPPEPTTYGMAAWRDEERRERERRENERRERERIEREQARERERAAHGQSDSRHAQPQGAQGAQGAQGKPRPPKAERPPQPPKPPKPPKVAAPRFELTDDLRATIEARYLELAQPVEFDGIRTQIATELRVPKALVKKAVADLRQRMALPSWWELQAYTGPEVELERIRSAYVPLLPVPEVGVHKTLAERLAMDPRTVYQGIRRIRAEMRLPQYNPPELHEQTEQTEQTATSDAAPVDAPTPGAQG
ncbi:MAG TPA: hypothetical protein VFQ25_09230 [Ktedonobacterales bacterium]|nr:hypothetical protein [Ktedonobacterales bacterium]